MAKKSQWLFWVCVICAIASVGTHLYLTNHHYSYKYGQAAGEGLCNINDTFNCNKTTVSQYSEIFGIPISIFGGLINFALLGLLLAFRFPIVGKETQRLLPSSIKIFTLGIFAVSLIMGAISIGALNTICPMCSLAYLLSFIGFAASWIFFGKGFSFSAFEIKLIGSLGLATLLFGYFFHHNSLREYGGKEVQEITRLQIEDWRNASQKNLVPTSPLTMNASKTAKVKMVEFADFLCGHCAQAFPTIHKFAKSHPDVEFSFQAFPLDGECNSAIGRSTGIQCLLARVSHCAGKQDKAWSTQEWIFKNQRQLLSKDAIQTQITENAEVLGLNQEELMSCVDSDEARKAIKAQADLGQEVGVQGTPTVFINGKKVPSGLSIRLLENIYREAK